MNSPSMGIKRLTALGVATASLLAFVATTTSSVQAAPCGRIHVGVSRHVVETGKTLRVAGATCGARNERPRFLRIKLHIRKGWRQIGVTHTRSNGHFSRRVRVRIGPTVHKTLLRVEATDARSASIPLAVVNEPTYDACPLRDPNYQVGMTVPDCKVVASDTVSDTNPIPFWGAIQCGVYPDAVAYEQATAPTSGGDAHVTATGDPQDNEAFRRMTVFDGDDFSGERCELGLNDSRYGPTAFYHEGERMVTFASIRLPENFPLDSEDWQTVFQMKQAQPANNGGGAPVLEMQATRNEWIVANNWNTIWTAPAEKNEWTRFAFDVFYSQNPEQGSIQISADLNDDGDFNDPDERSPRVHTDTLRAETAGALNFNPVGSSIPSHLRAGIYHNPEIPCPRPVGCSTEIDNVQVLGF